ncbi:DNA-binding response OmpR family regulator [Oikeobacillus pervagus]|uniref:Heme response regulator HssR n=1 Tax=Oikeobacillus pervagus TaxID=1325931 RepID=A0AAJ1T6E3_9BACI|nr:response regulator transcription factor [Oikeobacillus pervagus]MDQ0216744.1 DNA-binding response OmpR family regulator [Oikeobacillus pervagus]
MMTILVVDDDSNIRRFISKHLEENGFTVRQAADGKEALTQLESNRCDLAVVDVMMPHMDGFELTKEIRKVYDLPIILLTAKDQMEDKATGFRAGTDDYVVKPFEIKELLFRIQALLRRYDKQSEAILRIGDTMINQKSYEVEVNGRTFLLPLKEFELLAFLASNPNRTFTRSHLIEAIWGIDYEGDERTVDVHIKRLRTRVIQHSKDLTIKTVRGVGYQLEETKA